MELRLYALVGLLAVASAKGEPLLGRRKPSFGSLNLVGTRSKAPFQQATNPSYFTIQSSVADSVVHESDGIRTLDKKLELRIRNLASVDEMSGLERPMMAFQQCFESCGVDWQYEDEKDGNKLASMLPEPSDKLSCCKGGASALRMVYVGGTRATLYLPADPTLRDLPIIDTCGSGTLDDKTKSASLGGTSVKFANCDRCFPIDGEHVTSCDPSIDVWDSVDVDGRVELCLVSFDETTSAVDFGTKLPTNLVFYFQTEGSTDTSSLNLHTSCSKPIYPPYGLRLDVCWKDSDAFVDLSITEALDSPHLIFEDGVSAKDAGALFSTCEEGEEENTCCEGGASFLKMEFGGSIPGVIAFDREVAARYSPCEVEGRDFAIEGKKGPKTPPGKELSSQVRFVSCEDDCLVDPLEEKPCDFSFEMMTIQPGDEICLGVWDEAKKRILYSEKLPTNLDIFFVPDDITLNAFAAQLHTSCSKPLYPPFMQPFNNICEDKEPVMRLDDTAADLVFPHLRFLDGISKKFYDSASYVAAGSVELLFKWSFADCDCSCLPMDGYSPSSPTVHELSESPSAAPSGVGGIIRPGPGSPPDTESPSKAPSFAPSSSLNTDIPSSAPSFNPSAPSPGDHQRGPGETLPGCNNPCKEWVYANCVLRKDGQLLEDEPCDVDQADGDQLIPNDGNGEDGGRRLFESRVDFLLGNTHSFVFDSTDEEIHYHSGMIVLYQELLSIVDS